jgi:hypothetical protein
MKALLALLTLLLTIALSFSIGIAAGYAAICGILNAFAGNREAAVSVAQATPVHTIGD